MLLLSQTSSVAHHRLVGCLRGLTDNTLDHRSSPPEFESQLRHISLSFNVGLVHLVHHMHMCGPKITTFGWAEAPSG